MKIVITGGHHSSALPVIDILRKEHPDVGLYWIGHKYSGKGDKNPTLEYREITELKIPFYNLQAGKFYKTYDPVRLAKIPFGFIHALWVLLKVRPDVILSFGGYLAVPVVIIGKLLGIPSVTHEQTVVVGLANKVISRFVNKILISWPQSIQYFPKEKTVQTGLPLRKEIFVSKSNSFEINPSLKTVYLTAGKTGSHKINEAILHSLDELLNEVNLIHQCGDNSNFNDFDRLQQKYSSIKDKVGGKYELRKFVLQDEIGEAFKKADLVLIRGGAHTTLEAIALKKPALIIPIPWVSHNEQFKNAKIVQESGLGVILEEKDLSPESILAAITKMVTHLEEFYLKDKRYLDISEKDSARLIINEVLAITAPTS